jgi:hypothetical protein
MTSGAEEPLWLTIGYVPAVVFVAHMGWTALRQRRAASTDLEAAARPKIQVWLQDLMLFPPAYVLAMALGFDPRNLETLLFPSISLLIGWWPRWIFARRTNSNRRLCAGRSCLGRWRCASGFYGRALLVFERTIRAIRSRHRHPRAAYNDFCIDLHFVVRIAHGQARSHPADQKHRL